MVRHFQTASQISPSSANRHRAVANAAIVGLGSTKRRFAEYLGLLSCLFLSLLTGCKPVREDRTIQFNSSGDRVGFQHGADGVFIADLISDRPEKIFDSSQAIAVSSPRFSPVTDDVIFAVVHADPSHEDEHSLDWNAFPEGRPFQGGPVEYTCYRRRSTPLNSGVSPTSLNTAHPLFTARCNHVGYVASDLAVRWHPSGKSIVFVDHESNGKQSLYEHSLESGSKTLVRKFGTSNMTFEFSPNGNFLTCWTQDLVAENSLLTRLWLRSEATSDWNEIEAFQNLPEHDGLHPLEQLKRQRPVWTEDEQWLAFAKPMPSILQPITGPDQEPIEPRYEVRIISQNSTSLGCVVQNLESPRDLHWNPIRTELGLLIGDSPDHITVMTVDGNVHEEELDGIASQFLGWNSDGSQWSVTEVDETSLVSPDQLRWLTLLRPSPWNRHHLVVHGADSSKAPGRLLSGMGVTFPRWGKQPEQLAGWATFVPTYQSILSRFGVSTLGLGDPAFTLDSSSGVVHWKCVNTSEEWQVGHYHLLHGDAESAWSWYRRRQQQPTDVAEVTLTELIGSDSVSTMSRTQGLFEYICLSRLRRHQEANASLERFCKATRLKRGADEDWQWLVGPSTSILAVSNGTRVPEQSSITSPAIELRIQALESLLQHALAAEVFAALGTWDEGIAYFESRALSADSFSARLWAQLFQSQFLLAVGNNEAFVALIQQVIVAKSARDRSIPLSELIANPAQSPIDLIEYAAIALTAMPLLDREFLDRLTENHRATLCAFWQTQLTGANDPSSRSALSIWYLASLDSLDQLDEWQAFNVDVVIPDWWKGSAKIESPEQFQNQVRAWWQAMDQNR